MGLEKQLKTNKWRVRGCNKPWGVKCKHTTFCLQRSTYSQYILLLVVNKMEVEEGNKTTKLM